MPKLTLAFDRSVRHYDKDGRLHVDFTPISKANVCPYIGKEIPGWEVLGLDPGKIYQLFRDPDELKKAASTSNNIQLMQVHEGVSPDAPKQMEVVGTIGDKGEFKPPYLWNSLAVWVKRAIDLIESNRKKELSCSYHYEPDMTPGNYLGELYDGVMRNIHFNHVALVEDGRAGSDVMVADAMPLELKLNSGANNMPKAQAAISRKAQIVRGALAIHLKPLLAADQQIDLKQVLLGTTASNYIEFKPTIESRLKAATKGKLAKDADLEEVHGLLDSLDKEGEDEMDDDAEDEESEEEKEKREKAAKDKKARDKAAKDKRALDRKARDAESKEAEKIDEDIDDPAEDEEETAEEREERMKAREAAKDAMEAMDEEETPEEKKRRMEARDKAKDRAKDMEPKPITKRAMDSAINLAVERTKREMKAAAAALREAEGIVKPVLGQLAMDTADEVYKALFKARSVDIEGVDPSAFKAMAKLAVAAASASPQPTRMAMDQRAANDFATRFPEAARIRTI